MKKKLVYEDVPDELFQKIQEAQGFFFVADDGFSCMTQTEWFERIRGRLAWGRKAVKIMDAFLRKYGQADGQLNKTRERPK